MTFLDAAYLIAASVPSDALHSRAAAWSRAIHGRLITTDFVICEFVNFLSRPEDRPACYATLEWLRSDPRVLIEPASRELLDRGLVLHQQRPDKEWSLTDCISFEVMWQFRSTSALTHDHHFEQAGFEALLRHDPPA